MRQITFSAMIIILLLGMTVCGWSQSGSVPWAQVKKDAQTSESNQRSPAVQARLQQWFITKVRAYQSILNDTALGKANPKIIDLGDFTQNMQRVLAPPTGNGTVVVLFSDSVGTASTMEDNMDILFPKSRADEYIDMHPETCWHEFQHPITMLSEANNRHVAAKLEDWKLWRKPPIDSDAEHIYIESLGEYTVEWLDYLLHEKSVIRGGGPGLAFEKHCRDAYEQMKQYQARNESVSYAVENYCWAKAHEAWIKAWNDVGKLIAPMPRNLRDDYRQIDGVWIGFVEDIIKFYMEGGLTASDGKKIRVPEWVMWQEPMKSGIIIGHLDEKKEIKNNVLKYGFDTRVLETYRWKERSDSLNHGIVKISLENPDGDSKIELTVDGKPLSKNGAFGNIDLAGFKKNSRIRITFIRGNLQKLNGSKRYKILVEYKDNPGMVNGVQQPSFYYDSKAIYYIDVKGTGTGSPAASPSVSGSSSGKTPASIAAKPQIQPKPSGKWVLNGTFTKKHIDDMWLGQKEYQFNTSIDLTEVTLETIYTNSSNGNKSYTANTKYNWNNPGSVLTPGTKVPVTMTVADNGSVNIDSSKGGLNAIVSLYAEYFPQNSQTDIGVFPHPGTGIPDSNGGGTSIIPGSPKQTQSFTSKIPVPSPKESGKFIVRIVSDMRPITTEVEFHYSYEKSTFEQKPDDVNAELVPEEPESKSDPEQMDNNPPKPGEVVKIKDTKEETKPEPEKKKPAERWYTHAEGDYKFKLPDGWKVLAKTLMDEADDEYDSIFSPDEEMVITCNRSHTEKRSEADLKTFAQSLVKNSPKAKVEYFNMGKAKAVKISEFDKDNSVMSWQIFFVHQGRGYFMSINIHTESAKSQIPDLPAWMLESIQMLNATR